MKYSIIYTNRAKSDLTDIALYIAKDNIDKAIAYTAELKERISRLSDTPLIGVYPKKYTIADKEIRGLILDNYVALYKFENNVVEIRRVLNTAMLRDIIEM